MSTTLEQVAGGGAVVIVRRDVTLRQMEPHWNAGMIAASIAISFLGAFTSTQLFVPSDHGHLHLLTPQPACAKLGCPFIAPVYSFGRSSAA